MGGVANPGLHMPFGNYRVIANADVDHMWWSMVQPGASGVGLHLATSYEADCCTGNYSMASYSSLWERPDRLWHYPVFVHWTAITDPETKTVYADLAKDYGDNSIVAPMVGITSYSTFLDLRYEWDNIHRPYDREGELGATFSTGAGDIYGLVPVWEVIPISSRFAPQAQSAAVNPAVMYADVLDRCWCQLSEAENEHERDADGMVLPMHMPLDEFCNYQYGSQLCSCGMYPTELQAWEALMTVLPNLYEHFPYPLNAAVEDAVRNHRNGWEAIYQQAMWSESNDEKDKICFTSFLQQHSPYSPLYGPDAQITKRLLDFTSSETQQAS